MIILKLLPVRAQVQWPPERKPGLTYVIPVVTDVRPDPEPEETCLLTRADIMYIIIFSAYWARFL